MTGLLAAATILGCGSTPRTTSTVAFHQGPAALGKLPAALQDTPAPRAQLHDVRTASTFDTASLKGMPYIVTFLYLRCTTTCPLIGDELRQTLIELGPLAKRLAVVGVSVEPETDTPTAVRHWLRLHREPSSFHYLIGSRKQLEPVWKSWYTLPQTDPDGPSLHTAALWVVDAKGNRVAEVPAGAAVDPTKLAALLRRLLA